MAVFAIPEQRAVAPSVLWAPKSVSGDNDCSPNSWRTSIAVRIDGRQRAMTVARVRCFAGQNLDDLRCYL
jgi:hypothetical protein